MPRRRSEITRVIGPYKHPKGWQVTTIDPRANGGAGRRSDRYFSSLEEARDWKQIVESKFEQLTATTFAGAIARYRQHLKDKGNLDISVTETTRRLELFFAPLLVQPLSKLKAEQAETFYRKFSVGTYASGKKTKHYSVDFHRHTLAQAKTFMRWCVKPQGWIAANPLEQVAGIGRRNTGKLQLTGDEAKKLYSWLIWKATQGDQAALGALMLLTMALRQGDVIKRQVRDLDLDSTTLRVSGSKTKKGDRPRRVPEVLQAMLREVAKRRSPLEPLFVAEGGGFHTTTWLRAAMKRFCRDAEVPYVCPHGLKGTAGTLLKTAGASAELVADFLSHESSTTTERHYIDESATANAEQYNLLKVLHGGKK